MKLATLITSPLTWNPLLDPDSRNWRELSIAAGRERAWRESQREIMLGGREVKPSP